MHQNGTDNEEPKFSINSVKPNIVPTSGKQAVGVLANVHNSTNGYAGPLTAKAVVTQKGNKTFKIVTNKTAQSIAPTSNYNFIIPWGQNRLESGEYHLKLVYKTNGGLKSWELNKDFAITNNDAAKYNKLAGVKPNYLWLYILLAILALAIILGLGIYLGRRNNKKNNSNNNDINTTRRRRR
ncbi:WxL protein host-binding domain-containing protein [Companilactobacillus zhachilii]|uniref:WxL protein host-binding domain-containing protein n=1 Tax=Companilactobacillus zhachilii TaxID=2304606 RepID=UPI003075B7D7